MQETRLQWETRIKRELCKEYGCTMAEAADCIAPDSWLRAVELAAMEGKQMHWRQLDEYCKIVGESEYLRFFRGRCEQVGYLVPSVRKQQKQIYA